MDTTLASAPAVAFTDAVRFATNIVRVDHEMRSVMVTANGKIITEKIIRGAARLPALKEQNRLRKLYRCEGFEEGCEMGTFEVNQRVKVLVGIGAGEEGYVFSPSDKTGFDWNVWLDGHTGVVRYTSDELAPAPAVASAAADVSDAREAFVAAYNSGSYDDLRVAVFALQTERTALQAELARVKAERDRRRVRILHLRRALKEIETTSGDNNSVLDAKEALEQDYALASKEAQVSAPPADGEGGGGG